MTDIDEQADMAASNEAADEYEEPAETHDGYDGFVVGVGASAGGLEALERFFTNCPVDTGAAFVVVQHLSPDHKSMMTELLARYTKMPVVMVEDGMEIEPNVVFLIPAGTLMRLNGGRFELRPKAPRVLTLPIDIFFTSLSEAAGRQAVGVVLSGTGSDGSRGALAINAAGGFLMAQDLTTAKFDGMPSSVINTGLVDAILPAEAMPKRLISHMTNLPAESIFSAPTFPQPGASSDAVYDGILDLLLQWTTIDFREYKVATILRRIERRMQVRHVAEMEQYFHVLQSDRQELQALRRELLISVTNFFRDPDAFEALERLVIGPTVRAAETGSNLRVWVAGTSTGEEAYSIAMLFLEAFEQERRWPNLKIFATDVSQESIDIASAGVYPEATAMEITQERLERFFTVTGNSYAVRPELRQTIVFAKHNLLADPPFTQMNLVSCRNTLIYFTQEAQHKALQRLQFATATEGHLFLGSSESIAQNDLGFETIDSKQKLFQRTGAADVVSFDNKSEAFRRFVSNRARRSQGAVATAGMREGEVLDTATRALLQQYAPPSMLVNNHNEIIHLFGDVKPYFQAREGHASLELNRLLPEPLVAVASALMFKAHKDGERLISDNVRVQMPDGSTRIVRLGVEPVASGDGEALLLLSFDERRTVDDEDPPSAVDVSAETIARVEVLERELMATRESLQATIEELETSNEELQATNEELMASNEELQSSNEELQSVNEELNTINAEYQEKVGILHRVNADLDSMAKAVGVATVFVDEHLNLTRYSPDAVGMFKLRETDVGRPIDEVANTLEYPALLDDLRTTLSTERMVQLEVTGDDGRIYLARLLPYRVSNEGRGAVATFIDISAFRDRQRLQRILDALPEHIAVLSVDGTIEMVNRAWTTFARANGDVDLARSGIGVSYLDTCATEPDDRESDAARAFLGVKGVLEGTLPAFSFVYPCHSPLEERWFVMNVAPLDVDGFGAVVSHVNVTPWYRDGPGAE